jgi:hypothetical protein
MTSSPGSVMAQMALTKPILAPAVTMTRYPAPAAAPVVIPW